MAGEWWRSLVEKVRWEDPVRAKRMEQQYRRYDRQRASVEARQLANVFGESEIEMDSCAMRAEDLRGKTAAQCAAMRICYRCGDPLPPQKRRWCSRACENTWWENHSWTAARARAAQRDNYTCQRCGKRRGDVLDPGRCKTDGEVWPCTMVAGASPTARTYPHFRVGGATVTIEINHRDPLVGRGYSEGCVHHLDGIEALCHGCHVIETTRQGRERKREHDIKTKGSWLDLGATA